MERLRQSKLAAEAVRQGCATGEQQRAVSLKRRTEREYRDVDVYVQVNTAIDPKMFIPDLYKTGWRGARHRADMKAERTVAKVEARRLAAVTLGLGDAILTSHQVQPVVDELLSHVEEIMQSNFGCVGITRYEEGGAGFESEVVRSFAVDGGCAPSLVVRDGSIVLECKRKGGLKKLMDLGFRVEVLYRNKLVCNVRMVETGLHYALWGNRNRLWRHNGAGSYCY